MESGFSPGTRAHFLFAPRRGSSPTLGSFLVISVLLLASCSRTSQRSTPVPFPPVPAPTIPEHPSARLPEESPPELRPREPRRADSQPTGRVPEPRAEPELIRPASAETQGELVARIYRSHTGERMPYRLFVPVGYGASRPYPLVIFLHGSSGSGDDNRKQIAASGTAIHLFTSPESQAQYPCFVLVPQAKPRHGSSWVRQWGAVPLRKGQRKEPLVLVMEIIDQLRWEFAIDPSRLYIAGQSMGGFGTWIALTRYPDTFAAAIPVAGGGNPAAVGDNKTPVWAFHGSADRVVPVRRSRAMFNAFRKAGADPRYTEYKGVGHQSWKRAFVEPDLLPWLFSQRRGSPTEPAAITNNRTTLAVAGAPQ